MLLLRGSGKTTVLVERIINKIINEKIDIDKLLIVTFTNAAASEMRQRILEAIYAKIDENQMTHIEAIILSMTKAERNKPDIINGSRRKRIADGSGTSVEEVNKLLKQFEQMKKMMKQFSGGMGKRRFGGFKLPF